MMDAWLDDGDVRVLHGDCIEQMRLMPADSIDAICTDPPYGIRFMGKAWDGADIDRNVSEWREDWANRETRGGDASSTAIGSPAAAAGTYDLSQRGNRAFQAWTEAWAREAFRVLKPGGHLVSFCGTRTAHRMVCGIEDAGFEIRDTLAWLYGSGFPKSLDVSKAIDKAAGAEREIIGKSASQGLAMKPGASTYVNGQGEHRTTGTAPDLTAPATPDAERWQGWGTALKPAHEPITLARKPLAGTVAQNVLQYGTGALNIDACRIGTTRGVPASPSRTASSIGVVGIGANRTPGEMDANVGRWPANVILDAEAAAILDQQTGELVSNPGTLRNNAPPGIYGPERKAGTVLTHGDKGGASRFFYTAKSSSSERNEGLDAYGKICVCQDSQGQADSPLRDTSAQPEADANDSSTIGNGNSTTAPSPTDSKSTTGTATRPTTGSPTSSSSATPTTSAPTPRTTDATPPASGNGAAESAGSGSRPPAITTTSAEKAGPSTADADRATSRSLSKPSSAGVCPDCQGVIAGARRNVHPLVDGEAR